ncbi:cyanophycinase [Pseudoalteromonas fenneropenaei]|uniref:Cyanophycinase n=1 Tax=Pseudoalteromonas fenneropenaei TaxID=1737459 RepID=A0ABV7CL70_9GAMM
MNTFVHFGAVAWLFVATFSIKSQAQQLVLIGGALKTCASLSPQYCQPNTVFPTAAKTTRWFQITPQHLTQLSRAWPTGSEDLSRLMTQLKRSDANKRYSYAELLSLLDSGEQPLSKRLDDTQWALLLDSLEVPALTQQGTRQVEMVQAARTQLAGSQAILANMAALIAATPSKKYLAITASSHDPYDAADFYENLLNDFDVKGEWLALTIPLAQALSSGRCQDLATLRQQLSTSHSRERVYPERTQQEQLWCEKGVAALIAKIKSADAVFFNGGDQSLAKQVLFDEHNQPYPWFAALQSRAVIIGTSAGTALQSGGSNGHGSVAMVTNGTSEAAIKFGAFDQAAPADNCSEYQSCQAEHLNYLTYDPKGGLGSFTAGILDTHFSERSRTLRLATLLAHTGQRLGFGVDETTALVANVTPSHTELQVMGEHGVVVLESKSAAEFVYHYLQPADSAKLDAKNTLSLTLASSASASQALSDATYTDAIFAKNGFKNLVQSFCQSGQQTFSYDFSTAHKYALTLARSTATQCQLNKNKTYSIKNLNIIINKK